LAFSARKRDSSISSGVTALLPAPFNLPALAALIQLRSVWSLIPSSCAVVAIDSPALTRLTASSLNSAVYALREIFISCPSKVTSILRHLWKTKFQGKLSLAAKVQAALEEDPFSGHVFVFRGRRGDLIKLLWWTGDGLCLLAKRLERGRFVWPHANSGSVALTQAQLSMLLEGIDWRRPERTWKPTSAL
jgi:transposase